MTKFQQVIASWYLWALYEKGIKEVAGPKSNPRIIAYREMARIKIAGDDSAVAWCAIGVNAALEANGVPGTASAMAVSFSRAPEKFVQLETPVLGCVVVWWRQTKKSGLGHVAFYVGENDTQIQALGPNQGDSWSIAMFPKNGAKMGLIGYFWPKGVPIFGTGNQGVKFKDTPAVSVT
jgi:uncharacterized protein (TIGR02594 family)